MKLGKSKIVGNRGQDEIQNGDCSFSGFFEDSRPKRNQNTRRAIKDTRTSERAPHLAMGSNGTKQENVTEETDDRDDTLVTRVTNVAPVTVPNAIPFKGKRQIQLGDYCLPPDKREATLGGIASSLTTEYADPYETKQIVEALHSRGPRFSVPEPDIYELAKPTDDKDTLSKSSKVNFRHTYSEGSTKVVTSKSGTSVDSGVEDPDDYDHTITWAINNNNTSGKSKMAQVVPNPIQTKNFIRTDHPSSQSSTVLHSESKNRNIKEETLYAGPYEDPWDSTNSQQKFGDLITQAKKEYRKKSQSEDYEEPVLKTQPSAPTYEEAWDLKPREEQLENTVQEAHRRMSEGMQGMRRPNINNREPFKLPTTPEHKVKNSDRFIYSEAYEDPWDVKQREKEIALEERFSKAVTSPKSPRKDDVDIPNFPAPPPPQQEDRWGGVRPSSRSPHHSGNSPSLRRVSDANKVVAERINPDMPLDIQQFYHGKIGRRQAEQLLLIHREGSYLVRRSETQDNVFSLTLKGVGGIPMHLRISLENGLYILGENSKPFPTVPEMIDHYTQHELPVLKADRIKLLHPIPRQ